MKRMVRQVLVAIGLTAATRAYVLAESLPGSQLPAEENNCAMCHGEEDLWEDETLRLYIPAESLAEDVHFLKGVNCHDCHGGDPTTFDVPEAHATDIEEEASEVSPFRFPLEDVWNSCLKCHEEAANGLASGAHAEADTEGGTSFDCRTCHGRKAHGLLSVEDRRSPVFLNHQVQLCGNCHEEPRSEYLESVHGHGLEKAGLVVTAVCADCHGAHAVYSAKDERSTLFAANVAATCAECHRFIEERIKKSVHGGGNGPGGATERPAPGGTKSRTASCTDCHQGHDSQPRLASFRLKLHNRCGGCHEVLSNRYFQSMHGELTELGYGPAAKCVDCHGDHNILPVSDPASKLSPQNRLATCAQCHPQATAQFVDFDPHADHRDSERDPVLYWVYMGFMTFLLFMFAVFGIHSVLWLVRGSIDVKQNGRPRSLVPGQVAYVRFKPFHRVAHAIMAVSFLGLALTGLPLKYSHLEWAQTLSYWLGGFESTSIWHRFFGLVNIGCLAVYLGRMVAALADARRRKVSRTAVAFGPDSPMPNFRDFRDVGNMFRWFFGRGPKPTFERWSYWEKIDFWGACADIIIIGFTGMLLWFPDFFCQFLPGKTLNIAKVIHSTQALLATGFVFAVHFFATHIRPDKFPMDLAVFTGLVSEEEFREERPELLERMQQTGVLDEYKATVPSRSRLVLIHISGWLALLIGLALLAGIVIGIVGEL